MTGGAFPSSAAGALGDVADALRFFTRLPLPAPPPGPLDFSRVAWAAPLAGAVLGAVGAGVLALTQVLELPALVSAALATASLIAATGGLHEDGLADVADGFGGGQTRERKLEIMRDSRIGAYGAIALTLALILRVGALASILSHGFWSAAGALIIVAALSRAAALMPLALIDPARADGAGAAAGRLEPASFAAACAAALILAVAFGLLTIDAGRAIDAALASAIGAAAMTALALRQIGGQTGDVAGAAQQWAEIAGWCGLLMGPFAA
ncbi:MAG TPA: adenosylcobinamide-GDP ribazoletransferase [Roseiarcus sp.]|nr:adenosylcobinamide-GDP ribazoletransferase [Roseiarcus sp.]